MATATVSCKFTPLELQIVCDSLRVYKSCCRAQEYEDVEILQPNWDLFDRIPVKGVNAVQKILTGLGMKET